METFCGPAGVHWVIIWESFLKVIFSPHYGFDLHFHLQFGGALSEHAHARTDEEEKEQDVLTWSGQILRNVRETGKNDRLTLLPFVLK